MFQNKELEHRTTVITKYDNKYHKKMAKVCPPNSSHQSHQKKKAVRKLNRYQSRVPPFLNIEQRTVRLLYGACWIVLSLKDTRL